MEAPRAHGNDNRSQQASPLPRRSQRHIELSNVVQLRVLDSPSGSAWGLGLGFRDLPGDGLDTGWVFVDDRVRELHIDTVLVGNLFFDQATRQQALAQSLKTCER